MYIILDQPVSNNIWCPYISDQLNENVSVSVYLRIILINLYLQYMLHLHITSHFTKNVRWERERKWVRERKRERERIHCLYTADSVALLTMDLRHLDFMNFSSVFKGNAQCNDNLWCQSGHVLNVGRWVFGLYDLSHPSSARPLQLGLALSVCVCVLQSGLESRVALFVVRGGLHPNWNPISDIVHYFW